VPVEAGAILACEQRAVGAFADRSVDRSSGPWRERDERGLVALANDAHHTVSVGQRQIGQLGTAGFRDAQDVQRQ
jgi:hypothetical protein